MYPAPCAIALPMLVLGIESSCDETAAAVVRDGKEICSTIVASQIKEHELYGGVVPEIASRTHLSAITSVVEKALSEANCKMKDIDGIAVTKGPGLIGSLLVGVSYAKALSYVHHLPLIGVHHIEGHLAAAFINPIQTPAIGLVASGGHSNLYLMDRPGTYKLIGQTRDDAAGEAFDKVAKILGLGFPGGPAIEKTSQGGNPSAIWFPRAKLPDFEFSFSGLKTSVAVWNQKTPKVKQPPAKDIAASFQEAVVDMLAEKTFAAVRKHKVPSIILCGGVARNKRLRSRFQQEAAENNVSFHVPDFHLCTDNAAMIASAGYHKLKEQITDDWSLTPSSSIALHA